MRDFPGHLIGLGKIRQVLQPAVSRCSFEHLPERNDFLLPPPLSRLLAAVRRRLLFSMYPVFLQLAGGDLGQSVLPEEWQQIHPKTAPGGLHGLWVSLPLGDDFVLPQKLIRGMSKRLFVIDFPATATVLELKIPVFGKILRAFEALFPCCHPPLFAR